MYTRIHVMLLASVLLTGLCGAQAPDDTFNYAAELEEVTEDLKLGKPISDLERAQADPAPADSAAGLVVRSRHLIFGLPRLTDSRYAAGQGRPGVSLLVREGFVIGYSDVLRCPIWVAQRWSTDEAGDLDRTPTLQRDWKEDPDLPADLRIGTGYAGNTTGLDRGHMARHETNRAWGLDGSIAGCLITNSVPQHRSVNRGGAWRALEDAVRDHVATDGGGEPDVALWTISGALFRDTNNPGSEAADADLKKSATITEGFRVPYATYKIVAWFDADGAFQARGYIFEQPYTVPSGQKLKSSHFAIPDQDRSPKDFLKPIDQIEVRAGVDFFPLLKDAAETPLESNTPDAMW